jgi:hypothetical protein
MCPTSAVELLAAIGLYSQFTVENLLTESTTVLRPQNWEAPFRFLTGDL